MDPAGSGSLDTRERRARAARISTRGCGAAVSACHSLSFRTTKHPYHHPHQHLYPYPQVLGLLACSGHAWWAELRGRAEAGGDRSWATWLVALAASACPEVASAALGALCRGLGHEHCRACLLAAIIAAAADATAATTAATAVTAATAPPTPTPTPTTPLPSSPLPSLGESLEEHAAAPQRELVLAVASLLSQLPLAAEAFAPLFVRLHGPRCLELAAHHHCQRTRREARSLAAAVAAHLSSVAPDDGACGEVSSAARPCEAEAEAGAAGQAELRAARRRVEAVAEAANGPVEASFQEARVFFTGPRPRRHECE